MEGPVTGDEPGSLRLYEFDLATAAYSGRRWTYQLDTPNHAIGDTISVDNHRLDRDEPFDGPVKIHLHQRLRRMSESLRDLHQAGR